MRKIFVLGLGVMLLAAACNKSQPSAAVTPTPAPAPAPTEAPAPAPAPAPSPTPAGAKVQINITAKGFEPSSMTVKAGTVVVFKNMDAAPHWPASNPHPSHTGLPGFDALKNLATGATYSFTFTKPGTWGFHDHLNPLSTKGTIIVK